MAVNGKNIIIRKQSGQNWVAIAATKSDEIQVDCEVIKIAGATEQTWEKHIAGRKSWSLNVGWLLSSVADIRKALQVGDRVQLRIGDSTYANGGSGNGMSGYAIVKTCRVTMTNGALANGSFQFIGDGALT